MLIQPKSLIKSNKKTMSANTALKRKKQYDVIYDELTLKKLMQYYGFENREELLNFLKAQCIQQHESMLVNFYCGRLTTKWAETKDNDN